MLCTQFGWTLFSQFNELLSLNNALNGLPITQQSVSLMMFFVFVLISLVLVILAKPPVITQKSISIVNNSFQGIKFAKLPEMIYVVRL
jgi:hypothetical protein